MPVSAEALLENRVSYLGCYVFCESIYFVNDKERQGHLSPLPRQTYDCPQLYYRGNYFRHHQAQSSSSN